ncbi:MAG: hypothetical protein HC850_04735 [Rhodomicrobium sp.]|nr:hypothetical protein [Rhodomicrobium sp.]
MLQANFGIGTLAAETNSKDENDTTRLVLAKDMIFPVDNYLFEHRFQDSGVHFQTLDRQNSRAARVLGLRNRAARS